MGAIRFVLVAFLFLSSAFADELSDVKSNIIKTASGSKDGGRILDAVAIGDVGLGLSGVAGAYSASQADSASNRDMDAYVATFYCAAGMDGRAQYGESVTLPVSEEIINLRTEYAELLARTRERAKLLEMSGSGDEFDYSDVRELYSNGDGIVYESVLDTVAVRAASDVDNKDIKTGIALALGGIVTGVCAMPE